MAQGKGSSKCHTKMGVQGMGRQVPHTYGMYVGEGSVIGHVHKGGTHERWRDEWCPVRGRR